MSSTRKRKTTTSSKATPIDEEEAAPLIKENEDKPQQELKYSWDKTKQTPWKAIFLALFLFFIGTILIVIGTLLTTKVVNIDDDKDRGIPFLVLGLLCFIPGSYYVYVTYEIVRKNPKYSFLDFPEM